MFDPLLVKGDSAYPCAVLREQDEWGLRTVDLVNPPRRFWNDKDQQDALVEEGIDRRRLRPFPTPSNLLRSLPENDNWQALSRRSINRLYAHYLLSEDPQRRLDVREVETLAHQVSLVHHVLQQEKLKRVLIADEVGLGKTVEIGLILRELLIQRPNLRILYLAPARLVSNVRREFDRLGLNFRQWTTFDGDARLTDMRIIASIHRAVHGINFDRLLDGKAWDVVIVDECHHLSAWSPDGSDPSEAYRLVRELVARQSSDSRLILMSGTPHQGHATRFENLLKFLKTDSEPEGSLAGRVIYRTKDDIEDWNGNPVFPQRRVNEPLMIDLGPAHRQWLLNIHDFYKPPTDAHRLQDAKRRAAGWRCAQALQWAASSPQAGLGYLVRQAIRSGWDSSHPVLRGALTELRPYRLGPFDEPVEHLFQRIKREIDRQQTDADVEDIEDLTTGHDRDWLALGGLDGLLAEGIELVRLAGDDKWAIVHQKLLQTAGSEKVVLFAQPIETVTALAGYLQKHLGHKPAMIIGGQTDAERSTQVAAFWHANGPQFLVSSRAGGEGINLQVARRLIHIDVPWNPMDMEQRVGRLHRFGSRETVIVDTVIVKDTREADAYRIAREKLRVIASTLVDRRRFESVFSRVMTLLPQDELQSVLLNSPNAPFDARDEQRLAEMIQQGYRTWREFHDRFGEQQKAIRYQNPGLARWEDVAHFLQEVSGAKRELGHKRQQFRRESNSVSRIDEEAIVLKIADGKSYVCADGEELVYAADGTITPKLGLNLKPVAELLRKHGLPELPAGAAHLRWPPKMHRPRSFEKLPGCVVILLRQNLRMDRTGGWIESGLGLHCFAVTEGSRYEIEGEDKARLFQGIFRASVRKNPEPLPQLIEAVNNAESQLVEELRRPSEDELASQIRHGVSPLFAAVITD